MHILFYQPDGLADEFLIHRADCNLAGLYFYAVGYTLVNLVSPFQNLFDSQFQDIQVVGFGDVFVGTVPESCHDVVFR